jgi:hypothetical protein
MKLNNFFVFFFTSILILSTISQLFTSFYLSDELFTNEIENHLSSIVDIKSERINDYLIERTQDALILSNSKDLHNIFKRDLEFNLDVSKNNINSQLNILAKQINIFISRNPYMRMQDIEKNKEFKSLFIKTIGVSGSSIILDLTSKNIIQTSNKNYLGDTLKNVNDGFYNEIIDTRAKTSDGYSIGISAIAYKKDFKILSDTSYDLKESLNRFAEISNYENLILISPNNYVIYQSNENYELGSNLKYSNSDLSLTFSKIYDLSNQLNSNKVSIVGPYYETDNVDSNLIMSFGVPVSKNNVFLGTLILSVKMDVINNIVSEVNNLGETGETYLIDETEYLITKLKNQNFDLLIQEVKTENSNKCLNKNNLDKLSYYENLNGELVLGNYGLIGQTNWCLISEINYDEILNAPNSTQLYKDTLFILLLLFVLTLNIFILNNSLKKYNIVFNKKFTKEKIFFKFGLYFYLSSKILYLLTTQFYEVTFITPIILGLTFFELSGLVMIFYAIKFSGDIRK